MPVACHRCVALVALYVVGSTSVRRKPIEQPAANRRDGHDELVFDPYGLEATNNKRQSCH